MTSRETDAMWKLVPENVLVANLMRCAGLDKQKAKECAEVVSELLAAAAPQPPAQQAACGVCGVCGVSWDQHGNFGCKKPPVEATRAAPQPPAQPAGERKELIRLLIEDAQHHREIASCCDCRPEDTANWQHAIHCEQAAALLEADAQWEDKYLQLTAQTCRAEDEVERLTALLDAQRPAKKPLTLEQIADMCGEANRGYDFDLDDYTKAIRDAEAVHGIKEQS